MEKNGSYSAADKLAYSPAGGGEIYKGHPVRCHAIFRCYRALDKLFNSDFFISERGSCRIHWHGQKLWLRGKRVNLRNFPITYFGVY